ALLQEQKGGVRVGLAEEGGEQVRAVDLVASGRLHVGRGALEDALEAERLLRRAIVPGGERSDLVVEVGFQLLDELRDVAAAGADHLRDRLIVQQGPQHVLEAEELVPAPACLPDRQREGRLERARQPHPQASSAVQRSGNSCSRARVSTWATRVSATSRG